MTTIQCIDILLADIETELADCPDVGAMIALLEEAEDLLKRIRSGIQNGVYR